MATSVFDGAGGRSAPARNIRRSAVARLVAADARRQVLRYEASRLGLDDAGLATFGADLEAQDCVGRRAFFL
jgi:hypothetical protein